MKLSKEQIKKVREYYKSIWIGLNYTKESLDEHVNQIIQNPKLYDTIDFNSPMIEILKGCPNYFEEKDGVQE